MPTWYFQTQPAPCSEGTPSLNRVFSVTGHEDVLGHAKLSSESHGEPIQGSQISKSNDGASHCSSLMNSLRASPLKFSSLIILSAATAPRYVWPTPVAVSNRASYEFSMFWTMNRRALPYHAFAGISHRRFWSSSVFICTHELLMGTVSSKSVSILFWSQASVSSSILLCRLGLVGVAGRFDNNWLVRVVHVAYAYPRG